MIDKTKSYDIIYNKDEMALLLLVKKYRSEIGETFSHSSSSRF